MSDLEEHTLESAGDRCEECGAKLTPQEMQVVLENGGPTLCAIHAEELVDLSDDPAVDPDAPV
jgi:methionyl-tRNA synthetase